MKLHLMAPLVLLAGFAAGGDVMNTHDPNGSAATRTVDGVTTEFIFDARDRLVEVRQGAYILSRFQYDSKDRVILKIGAEGVRQYVYDGDSTRVLVEYDGAGNEAVRYTWTGHQLNSMTFRGLGTFFPLFDGLGSVVALINEQGSVVARYHYDAWGNYRFPEELQAHPNRYGFTGHRWQPEVDLYDANARYLDPGCGRFTSADPHPSVINDPATLHGYVYARNASTRYTDPLGLWDWDKTLGGKSSDAELRQEAGITKDGARRKEVGQILTRREAFRYGLQEAARARDALPEGADRERVARSLAAYGGEADPPIEDVLKTESGQMRHVRRVVIAADQTEDPRIPAHTAGPFTATHDQERGELRFDMETRVTVRPDAFAKDAAFAQVLAHEGSHAADYRGLHAAIVVETRGGTGMAPAIGNPSVDLTKYETEREAYHVSAATAQGQYALTRPARIPPSSSGSVVFRTQQDVQDKLVHRAGKTDYILWDARWRDEERAAKRDAAIDQYLLVGKPAGIYGVSPENPGVRLSGAPAKAPKKEPEP